MNFLHIAGHLGADPEVRFTSSGKKVTTLKVATRSRRKNQQEDQTIWWRVTLWGDQFDKLVSFLKKGSAVIVHGEIHKPEIFTDREGKPQVSLEITANHIEFSPFGKGSSHSAGSSERPASSNFAPQSQGGASMPQNAYAQTAPSSQPQAETFDDEVPF